MKEPQAPPASDPFDFGRYVRERKEAALGGHEGAPYAYSADLAMLATFRRMRPVELAAAAAVRAYQNVLRNQLLGTMVRVGPRQFSSIHAIAAQCADALQVPVPTVYVANNPYVNAYTYGTDEEAFIVVNSALIDHFDAAELKFVIGHETGHIQNKHVVYNTVLHLMKNTAVAFLRWILPPVELALHAWYRRAEITCDRAGLLCCQDLQAACRSFLKMACGSRKLYEELDVQAYLEQLSEVREGVGRFAEVFDSHPYLPKRIEAMRVFADSAIYRQCAGLGDDGLTLREVDAKTSEIIRIVGAGH